MNKPYILLLFCLIFSICLNAQYALDTAEVSILRAPLKINETGRNITIVTAKDIAAMPVTSLDEVLQTVVGVEVQSRGGFGVQADISMRGSTFTQVLILIDGMRMNDPLTGHFNGYIPVTPAEIERIEVLRGAASAVYGADAVGGVINIVTKTFAANNNDVAEDLNLGGTLNYGSHKLVSGYQGFTVQKGRATFGGGFSMNQSDGEMIEAVVLDSTTTLDAYHNFFDLKTVGASFGYRFNNNWHLRMRTAYDYRDFGARYFYTSSSFDKSTETVANWWNRLQVVKIGASSTTDFNVAYKYNTDEFVFSPDFPSTNNHTTQLLNFTFNHLQTISDRILLKAGLQADQRQIESNDRGNHEDWHLGLYALGVYQQNDWNISLSLRGDYDENYDFEVSPQLNVSYVLPLVTIRGAVGRSIRAADYTERYVSNNLENLTPGRSLGNPDLMAERSWSEEIGVDYNFRQNWQLKSTLFFRQSDNLIDYVSTNQLEIGSVSEVGSLQENADYFFAKNITDVNTFGVEAILNYQGRVGESAQLNWNLGYTYLSTSNDEEVTSVYISSHARHLLSSQLLLTVNRVTFGLNGLYKQRNNPIRSEVVTDLEESYWVSNARIGLALTENFGFNIQVQNIFDEQYQNILGAKMPGRWWLFGVKWDL